MQRNWCFYRYQQHIWTIAWYYWLHLFLALKLSPLTWSLRDAAPPKSSACYKMYPGGSRWQRNEIVAGHTWRKDFHCCENGWSEGNENLFSSAVSINTRCLTNVEKRNNNSIWAIRLDSQRVCLGGRVFLLSHSSEKTNCFSFMKQRAQRCCYSSASPLMELNGSLRWKLKWVW